MNVNKERFGEKLHPDHLADLGNSGLTAETIAKAGIRTVSPAELNKTLGFSIPGLDSAYSIPYGNGFSRFKIFYKGKGTEKSPKYIQPKGQGNRLYIPASASSQLQDISCSIYLTEGEKKSLKAAQEGLCCIGLSGLWSWSDGNKKLIPDFDRIKLEGRTIFIVPDNDWIQTNKHGYKKNLSQAVYKLAGKLNERGAKVFVVLLPNGKDKIGLDDFLCAHSIQEMLALPRKEIKPLSEKITEATEADVPEILEQIAAIKSETERDLYIQKISGKLKLSKRAIQKDLKAFAEESPETEEDVVISANLSLEGLVDVVLNEKEDVVYLFKHDNILRVLPSKEVDGTLHVPPEKEDLPFKLPRAKEVIRWYKSDNDQKLFEDVLSYLKRFSYLPDEQWLIVACVVFLSYIYTHPDIHYLAMLLFYASPERGKSRTGRAATHISFRGIRVIDLREANLLRFSQNVMATLFFDVKNLWKKAEKNNAEDILLSRFEKGLTASRVLSPEKGPFKDMKHFDIYGPTIIATNESVHRILDTRCIPINMPNKPGDYDHPTPDKAQELKERLTAWRARVMDKALPEIKPIKGFMGRLWDISQPLPCCKYVSWRILQVLAV